MRGFWAAIVIATGCGRFGFGAQREGGTDGAAIDGAATDGAAIVCPGTYTQAGTGCYRLGTGQSAAAAQAACAADGGHLAIIDSKAENDMLTAFEGTTSAWIGVVDRGAGFVLITTDVSPAFVQWAPGDPNGEGSCCRLLQGTGNWDDEMCSRLLQFLCEVDGASAIVAVP